MTVGERLLQTAAHKFRQKFVIPKDRLHGNNIYQWFPMHMYVSMKRMQARLRSVDCIVEVHDARIPFSGRNLEFRQTLYAVRPHILVLNKMDLIDVNLRPTIEQRLRETDKNLTNILWTNCKTQARQFIKNVMDAIVENVESQRRYNRTVRDSYTIMVVGIPNVGKSSLLNALRSVHCGLPPASKVGNRPGVTRAVQEIVRINSSPLIYMLDTPGVLMPNLRNEDVAMKMALCETVLQHLVGPDLISDYLLYTMNKLGNFKYVEMAGLTEPTDDIKKLLFEIALKHKMVQELTVFDVNSLRPDMAGAAVKFLAWYRNGKFGSQFVDQDALMYA